MRLLVATRRFLGAISAALAEAEVWVLAASIAYAALFSLFPLLVGLIVVLGHVVAETSAQQAILRALEPYLRAPTMPLVADTLNAVLATRGAAGTLALVGLFWGATAVAGALRHGINRMLRASHPRPFWRRKLVELAMVALAGASLSLSLLISTALQVIASLHPVATAATAVVGSRVFVVVTTVGPVLLSGLAFFVIYLVLPDARQGWPGLLAGTLTGLVLFEVTARGFFWYLRSLATYPLVYGSLAGLVVFMMWVYLAAVVALTGAAVMRAVSPSGPGAQPGRG